MFLSCSLFLSLNFSLLIIHIVLHDSTSRHNVGLPFNASLEFLCHDALPEGKCNAGLELPVIHLHS